MSGLDITQMLSSIQSLFSRMAHSSLMARIDSHGEGGGVVQDISKPLSEHLEELARKSTDDKVKIPGDSNTDPHALNVAKRESSSSRRQSKVHIIRERLNGLSKLFKGSGSNLVIQPHLCDQLQRSVRQHLNTSLRKAREGDITNAKLYADLASNAMHELSNYMPREDFTQFNAQISSNLKEFRDRDMFKPLTELSD